MRTRVGPPAGGAPRSAGGPPPAAAACGGRRGAGAHPRAVPGSGLARPHRSTPVWGVEGQLLPRPPWAGFPLPSVSAPGAWGWQSPACRAAPSEPGPLGPPWPVLAPQTLSMSPDPQGPGHPGPAPPGPWTPTPGSQHSSGHAAAQAHLDLLRNFPGARAGSGVRGRAIQQPLTPLSLTPAWPAWPAPYLCTWISTATPRSPSLGECSTLTTVSKKVTLILRSTEGWEGVSGWAEQQGADRVSLPEAPALWAVEGPAHLSRWSGQTSPVLPGAVVAQRVRAARPAGTPEPAACLWSCTRPSSVSRQPPALQAEEGLRAGRPRPLLGALLPGPHPHPLPQLRPALTWALAGL